MIRCFRGRAASACGALKPTFLSATAWTSGARHTYNLRQVQGIISNRVENEVLEPVDNVEELLTQRSHGVGGWV
jgi:hypothetical protein